MQNTGTEQDHGVLLYLTCHAKRSTEEEQEEEEEAKQRAKDGTRIKNTTKDSSIKQPTPFMSTPFCGAQMLAANNVGYYTQNNRKKKKRNHQERGLSTDATGAMDAKSINPVHSARPSQCFFLPVYQVK